MLDTVEDQLKLFLDTEITNLNKMSSVYSNLLLFEGQKNNLALHIDYHFLENSEKLSQLRGAEGTGGLVSQRSKKLGRLPTLDVQEFLFLFISLARIIKCVNKKNAIKPH